MIVATNVRLARDYTGNEEEKLRPYTASDTEILHERISASFGTDLGQAYINPHNGVKLVRLSRPVIVEHTETGRPHLLQTQYTRFSPAEDGLAEAYHKFTHPKSSKLNHEKINAEIDRRIKERDGKYDPFLFVTNPDYWPDVSIHRFPKTHYFAVYDDPDVGGDYAPFNIHEQNKLGGNLPSLWIEYHRQPYFANWNRENPKSQYDTFVIDFPLAKHETESAMEIALDGTGIPKQYWSENMSPSEITPPYPEFLLVPHHRATHFIKHDIKEPKAMGLVHRYLAVMLYGADYARSVSEIPVFGTPAKTL